MNLMLYILIIIFIISLFIFLGLLGYMIIDILEYILNI